MLSYLAVKNYAILENIEVSFEAGMTALTGETGAGKSLLIDAIGLLLGDRATTSIVRTGAEYCEISGLFVNLSKTVKQTLATLDIPCADDELLIRRQISQNSQNRIKVNNRAVTLQDLRMITIYLADIHTQHDTKRLINPETYLSLIDAHDQTLKDTIDVYKKARQNYLSAHQEYVTLQASKASREEKLDFYRFQIEEIKKHQLEADEDVELEQAIDKLRNFDKIYKKIQEVNALLKDNNALESIYDASQSLADVSDYDALYASLSERLKSAYYELEDVQGVVGDQLRALDFDPAELDRLETRQHTLDTLKRKYRKTLQELIAYQEMMEEEIAMFTDFDQALAEKYKALETAFETIKAAAIALTEKRKNAARGIEKALLKVLKDLELKDTRFEVRFNTVVYDDASAVSQFTEAGVDQIDFYLSTNVGEPLKPLSNVASGGELSRIMLALKEILMRKLSVSLMIFDEIDTGVSGFVASQVAEKMYAIAQSTQVLTITHLPQVAARAKHHNLIFKETVDGRTKANIKTLDRNGRIQALAEMISSDKVSDSALKSAEELLK